jgi:Transglutaminase-like superfamily
MKKIQKFWYLDRSIRYLLVESFFLLNSIWFGFLFLKFPLLQKLLGKIGKSRSDLPAHPAISIDKIVWGVEVSTQLSPGGAKCLARALTVHTLMQRQGYDPKLQIGVIKNPLEELKAHAWVEYQGKVVIGNLSDLEKYGTLHSV